MKSVRQDAKYEIIVSYYSLKDYKPLVHSISSLAQNLLGFSLAIKREVRIMLEKKVKAHLNKLKKLDHQHTTVVSASRRLQVSAVSTVKTLDPYEASILSRDTLLQGREYKDIDRLQSNIQPSLKRFISTCTSALDQIEKDLIEYKAITVKNKKEDTKKAQSTSKIDLTTALEEFKETEIALQKEYDEVDNVPTEDRFLVFTVIFTMVQFGKELISLQQHADKLIQHSNKGKWWISRIYLPRVNLKNWFSKAADQKGVQSSSEKVILDHRELDLKKSRNNHSATLLNGDDILPNSKDNGEPSLSATVDNDLDNKDDDAAYLNLHRKISRIATRIEKNEIQIEEEAVDSTPLQHVLGQHFWNRKLYSLTKWFQYGPT